MLTSFEIWAKRVRKTYPQGVLVKTRKESFAEWQMVRLQKKQGTKLIALVDA